MQNIGPIGIFDSGYGGLTIFKSIHQKLPQYTYYYFGDNARTPYGTRSFETIFQYTRECVQKLFNLGCPLVILACNTASAKALRKIQQEKLPSEAPHRRVLGVIRPTVEKIGSLTHTGHIGILATPGTVQSHAYETEIAHQNPHIIIHSEACPLRVPLIENNEYQNPGATYFIEKYVRELLEKDPLIDTLILGCTHYPLIQDQIKKIVGPNITLVSQGKIVAESLQNYLIHHPEREILLERGGEPRFFTTESEEKFRSSASLFLGENIFTEKIS